MLPTLVQTETYKNGLPLPFVVVMDLESLQFPTPRLVTAATFFQIRGLVNMNKCTLSKFDNENRV